MIRSPQGPKNHARILRGEGGNGHPCFQGTFITPMQSLWGCVPTLRANHAHSVPGQIAGTLPGTVATTVASYRQPTTPHKVLLQLDAARHRRKDRHKAPPPSPAVATIDTRCLDDKRPPRTRGLIARTRHRVAPAQRSSQGDPHPSPPPSKGLLQGRCRNAARHRLHPGERIGERIGRGCP